MSQVSNTELRQNFARYMHMAVDSRAPLTVTRQGGKGNVVIIAEEEFDGWQATVQLLRSAANADRLLRSIQSADTADTSEQALVEPKVRAKA